MIQNRNLKKLILFTGIAVVLSAMPADAAFEFKGPVAPAPVMKTPAPEHFPSPVGMTAMPAEKVLPVTTEVMSTPAPTSANNDIIYNAPAPALTPTNVQPVSDDAPVANGQIVSGFGSDLPLVIALQQVVPAGYQFSFGENVNPGTTVSWDGGAAWQTVLYDMLASAGLKYQLQNNVVAVAQGYMNAPVQKTPVVVSQPPSMQTKPVLKSDVLPVAQVNVKHSSDVDAVVLRRQKPSRILSGGANNDRTAGPNVAQYKNFPTAKGGLIAKPDQMNSASKPDVAADVANDNVAEEMPVNNSAPISLTSQNEMSSAYMPPAVTTDSHPGLANDPILMTPTWHGVKSQTLRDVLKTWSDVAGVELYWSIDYDYRLNEDMSLQGTYDEAVGQLLDRFAKVRPQPYGQLHQGSNGGQRVLVVKSYDLTN